MTDTANYFEENGYVVLQDVLTKEQADSLVKHMFDLHAAGKLVKDDQCPLSDAVYGDLIHYFKTSQSLLERRLVKDYFLHIHTLEYTVPGMC